MRCHFLKLRTPEKFMPISNQKCHSVWYSQWGFSFILFYWQYTYFCSDQFKLLFGPWNRNIISSSQLIITRLTCLNLPVSNSWYWLDSLPMMCGGLYSLYLVQDATSLEWWCPFPISGPGCYLSWVVVSIPCIWSRMLPLLSGGVHSLYLVQDATSLEWWCPFPISGPGDRQDLEPDTRQFC